MSFPTLRKLLPVACASPSTDVYRIAVTGAALLPFGLLHVVLTINVIYGRGVTGTYFGHDAVKKSAVPKDKPKPLGFKSEITEFDPLQVAVRIQGNFTENVPIALVAAALVEANGGDKTTLTYTLGALFVARLLHWHGLATNNITRAAGFFMSTFSFIGLSAWAGYLGYSNL